MGVFKFATTTYDLITLPLLLDKFKKKTIRIKVTWKFLKKMEECTFEVSDTGSFHVNSQILDQFNKHGYVVVRNLFTIEEISKLKDHFETHEDIQKHAYGRSDGNNRMSKLCIWNKAGDDLSGIVARYFHGKKDELFFLNIKKKCFSQINQSCWNNAKFAWRR